MQSRDSMQQRFPSVAKLVDLLPGVNKETAEMIRGLMKMELDPLKVSTNAAELQRRSFPPHDRSHLVMVAIDQLIGTYGVVDLPNKRGEYVAEYCNNGHTYAPTILFEYASCHFILTSWGDYVECRHL